MKVLVCFIALFWSSCHCQILDDGIGDVILMLQKTMDILFDQQEKISKIEEHMLALSASQEDHKTKLSIIEDQKSSIKEELSETLLSGLQNITETLLNSSATEHKELLPSLQKCSGFYDLIINRNECSDGSHRCSEFAQCIDLVFGFKCSCLEGYSGDGFHCEDINECLGDPCHPEAECQNFGGHYTCTCKTPYNGDGRTCDIDECNGNPCDPHATCQNSIGSYTCTCKEPYVGDGTTCELNCQDYSGSQLIQDLGCVTFNTPGRPWESARRNCLSIGMKLLEDIPSRQHFRVIYDTFQKDEDVWIGAKSRRWSTSGEVIADDLYFRGKPDKSIDSCIFLDIDKSANEDEGLFDYSCTSSFHYLCQFLP